MSWTQEDLANLKYKPPVTTWAMPQGQVNPVKQLKITIVNQRDKPAVEGELESHAFNKNMTSRAK